MALMDCIIARAAPRPAAARIRNALTLGSSIGSQQYGDGTHLNRFGSARSEKVVSPEANQGG